MSKKIDNIIEELIEQYLEDDRYNRPWIIGFSGGKIKLSMNNRIIE